MDAVVAGAFTLEIVVRERIAAKNVDDPLREHVIAPGSYAATIGYSEFGTPWLLMVLPGGRFGWPYRALPPLLDDDKLRILQNGEEISSLLEV